MLARATAATPWGIEARPVQVEVDVHTGLPQIQIVGLADAAVRESRERVRTAIKNCGFDLEPTSIIINLAPADLRKEGNHLDLAIALAMLAAYEQIPQEALAGRLICGELGLDGAIRSVRGGLAIADLGRRLGCREVLLPAANAPEAAALEAVPVLGLAESIAVTKIHSLVAEEPPAGLLRQRPFRSPHTGTSTAGMIGGGSNPRPGEASLAHNGVLFLDELPEFRRDTLEALRQPLEEGTVSVVRARARLCFPARFSLLAAMNPCPCGHRGDPRHACRCPPLLIERYRGRVSGPLLDRIDLHVEVPAVSLAELRSSAGESTQTVAARVAAARAVQLDRFGLHT